LDLDDAFLLFDLAALSSESAEDERDDDDDRLDWLLDEVRDEELVDEEDLDKCDDILFS
jgi:hypothetical protein